MFVRLLLWMVPLLFLNRRDQCLRIIALQQQLEVYQRRQRGRRLQLTEEDWRFWVCLSHDDGTPVPSLPTPLWPVPRALDQDRRP